MKIIIPEQDFRGESYGVSNRLIRSQLDLGARLERSSDAGLPGEYELFPGDVFAFIGSVAIGYPVGIRREHLSEFLEILDGLGQILLSHEHSAMSDIANYAHKVSAKIYGNHVYGYPFLFGAIGQDRNSMEVLRLCGGAYREASNWYGFELCPLEMIFAENARNSNGYSYKRIEPYSVTTALAYGIPSRHMGELIGSTAELSQISQALTPTTNSELPKMIFVET